MYTQCPECRTIFEIDEEALQASFGIVHCGHCAKRFDALRSLSNALPLEPDAGLPELADAPRIPTLTAEVSAAALAASRNRRRRDRPETQGPPASEDLDAEALRAATDNDDWFAELQADLDAELEPEVPAAAASPESTPPNPDDDFVEAADTPDVTPVPVLERTPAAPAASDTAAEPEPEARISDAIADVEAIVDAPAEPPEGTGGAATPPPAEAGIETAGGHAALGQLPADPAPANGDDALEAVPPIDEPASDQGPEAEAAAVALDDITAAGDPPETQPAPQLDDDAPAAPPPERADPADPPAPPPDPALLHGNVIMYVRPLRGRHSRAGLAWALGCAALAVLLAAQIAWAERAALYRNPSSHAWMSRVCQTLACRLPPIHDPTQLALVARDVRPDPRHPDALSITATLRNDASVREAWPVVTVVLTDIDNQPVAMRRFRPGDYMPDRARRAAGIAPGATVAVAFEVADPGKQARGFQFTFE